MKRKSKNEPFHKIENNLVEKQEVFSVPTAMVEPEGYSVYTKEKEYVRTYSRELHGENFKTLAEGYAKKIGGFVK